MVEYDEYHVKLKEKRTSLKPIKPIKNKKTVFKSHKNMHLYFKNCKIQTGNTFSIELVLISKNKIKGKSKCAICLTEMTFIHGIQFSNLSSVFYLCYKKI